MYYHNSHFQNISKFRNGFYFNFKNKFFNTHLHDLSSTMMAVYPDGVVGIISINKPSSSLSQHNIKNFNHYSKSKVFSQDSFTSKKSNSDLSIKSAPADYCHEFDTCWKQGDECFAPYINGDYYSARFESYGPADLCVIFFHNFAHHSYVPTGTLYSHF